MSQPNRGLYFAVLVALLATTSEVAQSCSVTNNFLRPSNYELVKHTERIVLARAQAFVDECKTSFEVLEAIKGESPSVELVTRGCSHGPEYAVLPEDETSFHQSRGSRSGSCNRMSFELGQTYVLFLVNYGGSWQSDGPPFSRIHEPVSGTDSPWYRAVSRYVEIASLSDYEGEKRELQSLEAAGANAGERWERTVAIDVAEHFATVSDHKSYDDLRVMYDQATDDDVRTRILVALANRGDVEAKPLFEELLVSGRRDGPVANFFGKIGDTASIDVFLDAFLAAGKTEKDWWARITPLSTVLGLAETHHISLVLRAYADASQNDEIRLIEQWLILHPHSDALPALRSRVAGDYEENYDAAFALAANGDQEVARWAIQSSADVNAPWQALYVLAHSPLEESDTHVRSLIASPDARLVALAQGYADSVNPHLRNRLEEILAIPDKSKELDAWLWRSISELKEAGRLEGTDELLEALPADARAFFDD